MTSPTAAADGRRGLDTRALGEHAAVAVALAGWALVMVPRTGGRDTGTLTWSLALALPALVLTRPADRLHRLALVIPAALLGGALATCVFAPARWSGLHDVAVYAYGAVVFLLTAAYCRSATRAAVVGGVFAVAGLEQFRRAFLPWWGGEDVSASMLGTFYWHNQFGVFEAAAAMVGLAVALNARGPVRLLGGLTTAVALTGVLLSGSRASALVAAVGAGLLVVDALVRQRRRAVVPLLGLVAATVVFQTVITGPAFFAQEGSGGSVLASRTTEEPAAQNARARIVFWKIAGRAFAERPVVGAGFGSFFDLTSGEVPPGILNSPYAHNAYLQAMAEGGLATGLPLGVAAGAVTIACGRVLLVRRKDDDPGGETAALGAACVRGSAVAALVLLAHSAVDFDWAYPALVGMTAVCAGVVVGQVARRPGPDRPWRAPAPALLGVGLVAVTLLAIAADRRTETVEAGIRRANGVARADPLRAGAQLNALRRAGLPDPRIDEAMLKYAYPAGSGATLRLPEAEVRRALRGTAQRAAVSPSLRLRRLQLSALLRPADLPLLAAEADRQFDQRPTAVRAYADVLVRLGRQPQAEGVLVRAVVTLARPGQRRRVDTWLVVDSLTRLDAGEVGRCAFQLARDALGQAVPREVHDPGAPLPSTKCSLILDSAATLSRPAEREEAR